MIQRKERLIWRVITKGLFKKLFSTREIRKFLRLVDIKEITDNSFPKFVYHVIEENCQIHQ